MKFPFYPWLCHAIISHHVLSSLLQTKDIFATCNKIVFSHGLPSSAECRIFMLPLRRRWEILFYPCLSVSPYHKLLSHFSQELFIVNAWNFNTFCLGMPYACGGIHVCTNRTSTFFCRFCLFLALVFKQILTKDFSASISRRCLKF